MKRNMIVWIILTVFLLTFSCKKKEEEIPPPTAPPPTATVDRPEEVTETDEPDVHVDRSTENLPVFDPSSFKMEDVFFDFDEANLREDAKATLIRHAEVLRANPEVQVLIEGHCDERGTNEYNLALGERRATRVQDYMVSLGIDKYRMRTISYGEERPVADGHDEDSWAQNRRAHFKLSK